MQELYRILYESVYFHEKNAENGKALGPLIVQVGWQLVLRSAYYMTLSRTLCCVRLLSC